MSSMRKLLELFRGLSSFLAEPATHVTEAWATVKGAIDPEAYNADALNKSKTLKNAVVVIDNVVTAVTYYLDKETTKEPEQKELTVQ
jgi:hypothetical protein